LPEERGFLHDIQAAACKQFSTVLAPGANPFHYNHIHVDLARHGRGHNICNPAPVSGGIAARTHDDAVVTGSVGTSNTAQSSRHPVSRSSLYEFGPPPADVAGED
jgi:hypothetical protein